MMKRFGATLRNVRWSWDATTADGSIIFIGWEDEAVRGADGAIEGYDLSYRLDRHRHGARERKRHVEELLATQAVGYLAIAVAKDPGAHPRSIADFRNELLSVQLDQRESNVYATVIATNSDPFALGEEGEDSLAQQGEGLGAGTTETAAQVKVRRGQGRFRARVEYIERAGCRVTGVRDRAHLRAGHIKPWHLSTDAERLDGNNGLLLAPHIDHLFDRGFISFSDEGEILVSDERARKVLSAWGVDTFKPDRGFNPKQCGYLAFHRENVFRAGEGE